MIKDEAWKDEELERLKNKDRYKTKKIQRLKSKLRERDLQLAAIGYCLERMQHEQERI